MPRPDPVAAPKPVPRVIQPAQRSPGNGVQRFKVQARDHARGGGKYVLAVNAASAEAHYRKVQNLADGEPLVTVPLID